ncbi:hypothetical protein BCD67_17590 [Oscillatoriales cyanobacterium USR001]|nr:hypothetical protein BCD67_17590 [Oscillatoriales cyanobacterium USR001]
MEIKTDEYQIWYDRATASVFLQGSLRLTGEEYEPLVKFLEEIAESEPEEIILNLQKLEFLNSSGISMLSKFVIKVRQKKNINMEIKGSKAIPWQGKSLRNLLRLMPALKLELE